MSLAAAIGLVAAGAGATILTEHAARLPVLPDVAVVAIASPLRDHTDSVLV